MVPASKKVYTSSYIRLEPPKFSGKGQPLPRPSSIKQLDKLNHLEPFRKRGQEIFNQKFYKDPLRPINLGQIEIDSPRQEIFVARMLIRKYDPNSDNWYCYLPDELSFCRKFLETCFNFEQHFNWEPCFYYLTIRSGPTYHLSNDDTFHVDGFQSTHNVSVPRHIPERNYLWTSSHPTEFLNQKFFIENLDSSKYNVHKHFEAFADSNLIYTYPEKSIVLFDPYMVHRRPKIEQSESSVRTMIRLTAETVLIQDDKNTQNPFITVGPFNKVDVRDLLLDEIYQGD